MPGGAPTPGGRLRAIRELRKAGQPVTFAEVARRANVSRGYLHQHTELSARIKALSAVRGPGTPPPASEASESGTVSLLRAQEAAHREKTAALLARTAELEAQLAAALGVVLRLRETAQGGHGPITAEEGSQ